MECVLLQNYQNKEHHYLVRTEQSNEFEYQGTHQDLLHTPYPFFG